MVCVKYDLDDGLFTEKGMRNADQRLRALYSEAGDVDAYCGEFYAGPHKFDLEMQASAFAWLKQTLGR